MTAGHSFIQVRVLWNDRTRYGATLSGRAQDFIRETLHQQTHQTLSRVSRGHPGARPKMSERMRLLHEDRNSKLYQKVISDSSFWYPEKKRVWPGSLILYSHLTGAVLTIPLAKKGCEQFLNFLHNPGGPRPILWARFFEDTQEAAQRLNIAPLMPASAAQKFAGSPLFVGHACLTWSDGAHRLWADPLFSPKSLRYPSSYQPLSVLDFPENEHAVLLTHSHPDHFDPGSLLRFAPNTIFFVPEVLRESLLSVDMKFRLRQLGFHRIRTLRWQESAQWGLFKITALPFYGEQPLGGGPSVELSDYNRGNTYCVEFAKGGKSLILADSGSDPRKNCLENAFDILRDTGPIDYLFANHRRWDLDPSQYLRSSVPQYLCYVPDGQLGLRQRIMMNPQELVRVAEILGARFVIPYAMGGAAWHEEMGLGFNHLRRDLKSTPYDSSPEDLRNIRLKKSWVPTTLLAGQYLSLSGRPQWPKTIKKPRLSSFKRREALPRCHYIAIAGKGLSSSVLQEISSLLFSDKGAFFLATARFCEVYGSPNKQGVALCQGLQSFCQNNSLHSSQSPVPMTARPFSENQVWLDLFRAVQRRALRAPANPQETLSRLRGIRFSPLFGALAPNLIAATCRSLLGFSLPPVKRQGGKRSPRRIPRPLLMSAPLVARQLPPQARRLMSRYGASEVLLSLMLIKVLHNGYLTMIALQESQDPLNESDWLLSALTKST